MARVIKPRMVLSAIAASLISLFLASVGMDRRLEADQAKPKSNPEPSFQHEVTVTLKLIQVFVTDASGKPALDLAKSDFTLTDNGQPQKITDFEQHVLGLPAARPTDIEPAPPVVAPSPSARSATPLLSRKFIFLIDCCQNVLEGVGKAKLAALAFMASKTMPDDEVALFTLSPVSGLTLYENLTKDHAKVRNKIKKLREFVGGGRDAPASDLTGMELMNAQIFAVHGGHAGPTQRNLFADIAEWAKALRAIPGQKNIILFTMGFGTQAVRPGRLNNILFETMARALASANAPVFTVDTTPQELPGREVWDKLPSGTLPERSLAYLSETTGGKFLGGVNYAARIAEEIHDATANYYVLGYYIPASWDGKFHDVKVEVRRAGFTVHGQRGYFNPVPFAKLSPIEKHIHLLSLALGDTAAAVRTLDFPMAALPFAAPGQAANVLLISGLAPDTIRREIGDRTEFITLILDQNNAITHGERAEVDWKDLKTGSIYQYGLASLAPGHYDCRAVVRNLEDGRAAVGACAVEVTAQPAEGSILYPPLLLVKGRDGRYLDLTRKGDENGPAGLSITRIYPFPAKDYVPLVGPLDQDASELWAMLKGVWRGARSGEIELACSLKAEGGSEEIPVQVEILSAASSDDGDSYLLRLELPALRPGRWALEIRAEGEDGPVARTAVPFSIRAAGRRQ